MHYHLFDCYAFERIKKTKTFFLRCITISLTIMLLRESECQPINHEWLLSIISDGNSNQFVVDSTQT